MIKITLVLAIAANLAFAAAMPIGDVIAARQVRTEHLRHGSRRLSARQAGPSNTPTLLTNKYINCPTFSGSYYLSDQTAEKYVTEGVGRTNNNDCAYSNGSGGSARCVFDEMGTLTRGESTSTISVCPQTVAEAPTMLDNANCYLDCPRRMNGDFFAAAQIDTDLQGVASILCSYGATEFDLTNTNDCKYSAETGALVLGSTVIQCAATIPRGTYCAMKANPSG